MRVRYLSLQLAGKKLLDTITVDIPPASLCTVLGANGAGKTLFLRCLSGLIPTESGSVSLADGRRLAGLSVEHIAAEVSWTPLSAPLPFAFKVSELMLMGRYRQHQGFPKDRDRMVATEALARMKMMDFANRAYNSLSRGEQTKVDIARAIATETPVLIFDEPFANLDIDACLQVQAVFRDLCREGRTIILSHHDLHSVSQLATHVLLIRKGRLIAAGPCREVFNSENIRATYQVEAHFLTTEGQEQLLFFKQLRDE